MAQVTNQNSSHITLGGLSQFRPALFQDLYGIMAQVTYQNSSHITP
jgi:hypothetical protein